MLDVRALSTVLNGKKEKIGFEGKIYKSNGNNYKINNTYLSKTRNVALPNA